ncbi:glycosyltransferase family 4 protein [Guyparkeria hydrothermalis]|uniref:glycosyltransferase family 4 protein n=1 Tax=Guyparkeria hydrothermalis TaxID=923 RepID=UPI00201FB69A|nr:glycosyltransferase family 4 protein [Guyparkeria hydrothermalis]MCL7744779.1 glycosyltransferase family 4 protein [Guyparkeria hydrothermalis]
MLPALDGGGVERGTLEIAEALVRAGHRAIVISEGGRLVEELEALGAEHVTLPVGRKSLLTLRYIPTVRRLLRDEDVDILHLRSRLPAWIGYLAWRGMKPASRPRLVTTVHGAYTPGRYSAVMTKGERVIAVSDSIVRYIREHYPDVDPERIVRFYRGIDPADYYPAFRPDAAWRERFFAEHPTLADRWLITLPGRITQLKGHRDLLEIVAGLKARGVPVHALLAGGVHPRRQAYWQDIQARITELGLAEDITWLGPRRDLREILAISDVVLSLTRKPESFGRTVTEALALGRPVLGYDHGGVGEQLERVYPEGRVPPGDIEAAVDRLAQWWHDGVPSVTEGVPFTLDRMQDETLALYQSLAAERS